MVPVQQGNPPGAAAQGQQCIFCQIVSGAIPSRKVYEDELVLAILDIRPASPGHILIMPKQHVMAMPQLPAGTVARLGMTVKVLSKVLLQTFQCTGTSLFVANGAAAGQRVPHFMMHLIPRQDDDGLPFQLDEQEVTDDFLRKLRLKLTGKQIEGKAEPAEREEEAEESAEGAPDEEFEEEPQEEEDASEDEEIDLDDVESLLG